MSNKGILSDNKTLVKGIVAALIALGLILSLISQLGSLVSAASYPAGEVKKTKTDMPEFVAGDVLSRRIMCPTVGYKVAVTKGTKIKNSALIMNEGDVCYVVMESAQNIEEMCEDALPNVAVSNIIGFGKDIKIKKVDTGYVYGYVGSYCVSSVKVQQTTGKEMYHALCYEVDLGSINNLFFYAVTKDKGGLETAEEFLLDLIVSLEKAEFTAVEDIGEEVEAESVPEESVSVIPSGESVVPDFQAEASKLTTEDYYLIANVYTAERGYEDTIFFIEWFNAIDEPMELTVTGPNGQIGVKNEEFSSPGHYVYEFGTTTEGKYILEGKTKEQLSLSNVCATSREHYMELYWDWLDADNIIGHEPED